jgi:hypothetical protein
VGFGCPLDAARDGGHSRRLVLKELPMRFARFVRLAVLASFLAACGGGSPEPLTPAPESELPTASKPPGNSGGAYDPCAGKATGDACRICPPDDADCVETMELKACNAEGKCTSAASVN